MEKQQDSPPAMLCRAGCGFFGHQAFDNYCSKCYHNHQRQMQAQQQAVASVGPVANSSSSHHGAPSFPSSSSSSSLASSSSSHNNFAPSTATSLSASQTETPSATTTTPAAATTNPSNALSTEPISVPAPSSSTSPDAAVALFGSSPATEQSSSSASSPSGSATKTPRRCAVCNKRTGLTGFECRGCAGWHCTEHRYPDKHSCSFDYKAADRDRLRRENPAVIGEKIQKI